MTLPSVSDNKKIIAALIAAGILFSWDEGGGVYIDLITGNPINFIDALDALSVVIGASQARMHNLTQQLIDGQISLAEWQAGMMEQIKIEHTLAAAAGRGGWYQMSQADWGFTGRLIRTQYDFLRNFANEIASGKQRLDGTALVRSDLYGRAARGTFEEMRRRFERLMNGAEEERRILGVADHCNGCLDQAALSWQPAGTLDPIGAEECLTNCHCHFIFRRRGPDGGWIVAGE